MSAPRGSPVIDKEKKYDRQLRLWGDHGQVALESAQICLINATATGTEILKNLILPGIGSFSIVDGNMVSGEDVGNNFFLEKQSIGKSRAQVAKEFLQELNSDVKGDFVEETAEQLLENNPNYFYSFSIVIATDLAERTLLDLAASLWNAGVPLLVCRSYGLIGYMRLAAKEHTVIESHPDNAHGDLHLDQPFPSLIQYLSSMDMSKMTRQEHMHTPYLVILYKYLEEWKAENDGKLPKTYKEKESLRQLIRNGILINEHGVPETEENFDEAIKSVNVALVPTRIPSDVQSIFNDSACINLTSENLNPSYDQEPPLLKKTEENFDEAIKSVNVALVPTRIPSDVQSIFNDSACINLTSESSSFWIMAHAVKQFTENEGKGALPLRGSIPDMFADSKRYIQLQNVYVEQAKLDQLSVLSRVQQILKSLGRPSDAISESEVKMFCKNAHFLRVVRCRSLSAEYATDTANVSDLAMNLENPDSEIVFYILLRAVDRFHQQYNIYPGSSSCDDQVDGDTVKLKSCVCALLQELNIHVNIKDDYINEVCRYGAAEIHPVAAFMGGAAAQEAIKIISKQFVPFNNTFIYNAITASSATFQL